MNSEANIQAEKAALSRAHTLPARMLALFMACVLVISFTPLPAYGDEGASAQSEQTATQDDTSAASDASEGGDEQAPASEEDSASEEDASSASEDQSENSEAASTDESDEASEDEQDAEDEDEDDEGESFTVTYNLAGGSLDESEMRLLLGLEDVECKTEGEINTIEFKNLDEGDDVPDLRDPEGTLLEEDYYAEPTREGYEFKGWKSSLDDAALDTIYSSKDLESVHVSEDVVYTAEWEEALEEETDDDLISVEDAEQKTGISVDDEGRLYREGEVLVTFSDGTDQEEASDAVEESPAIADDEVDNDNLIIGEATGDTLEEGAVSDPTALLETDDGVTVVQAVAEMQDDPNVVAAQPNYIFVLDDEEYEGEAEADSQDSGSDEELEASEASDSAEQESVAESVGTETTLTNDPNMASRDQEYWEATGIYSAWSLVKCNNSVSIAILDTGCNVGHEDLASNIVATYNAVDDTTDVTDTEGHGTHVAGIAAAAADNNLGIAGTSYNANLCIVNVFNSSGTADDASISRACDWVIRNQSTYNIRVINMSLGSVVSDSYDWSRDIACQAIDRAEAAGVLTVAAAGNRTESNNNELPYTSFPGDYAPVLSVMNLSTTCTALNGSSNSGKDVSAPGTSVYSTLSDGGYGSMSGTSMSSPFVAGVAALCFAANPSLSPADVHSILVSTSDSQYCNRVNAQAAIEYITGEEADDGTGEDDSGGTSESDDGESDKAESKDGQSSDGESADGESGDAESGDGESDDGEGEGEGKDPEDPTPADPVSVEIPSANTGLTYNGQVQTGVPSGTGYTLTGNTATNAGLHIAVATLEDTDAYVWADGSTTPKTITWMISRSSLIGSTVSLSSVSLSYTGNALTPSVTVTKGGRTLLQGVDYSLSYSNNTKPGTATVTVTGIGNYTGYVTKSFTITKPSVAKASVTLSCSSYSYNGTARKPGVVVKLNGKTLAKGTDYTVSYSNNTKAGTATVTITGTGNYTGTIKKTFTIKALTPRVSYTTHVQNVGWQSWVSNGTMAGTSGKALRLEGIKVSVSDCGLTGSIQYRTHIQNIGWESSWKSNGTMSGTSGRSLRLEAIQIRLTGNLAKNYDVYYRVHAQNIGWMGWAKNGAQAGTAGYAYRLEGIQIVLVKKGSAAPSNTYKGITGKGSAFKSA